MKKDVITDIVGLLGLGLVGWGVWEIAPCAAKIVVGTVLFLMAVLPHIKRGA